MLKECLVCRQVKEFGSRANATTCSDCLRAGYKYCVKCHTVRPVSSFYMHGKYPRVYCKECTHRINNAYHKTERGKRSTATYHATTAGRWATRRAKQKYSSTAHGRQTIANARHKRRGAYGSVTAKEWQSTLEEFSYACAYCGSREQLTQDHVVAITAGGANIARNIVPACRHCNSSKSSVDIYTWYSKQPFFTLDRYNKILHHMEVK